MKKAERKILEKNIITSIDVLLKAYDEKAGQKLHKAVKEHAKNISKKFYKAAKDNTDKPADKKSKKPVVARNKAKKLKKA